MKVLIDGIIFRLKPTGGIARYWNEIFKRLAAGNGSGIEYAVTLPRGSESEIPEQFIKVERTVGALLTALRADVFNSTYYRQWPSMRRKVNVVTVYDWIDASLPLYHPNAGAGFLEKQRKAIKNAAHVVAISEDVKRRTMEFAGFPEERISVAAPAVGGDFTLPLPVEEEKEAFRRKYGISRPYLLHVGNRRNYKNFRTIIEAWISVSDKCGRDLVIAGGEPNLNDSELYAVSSRGLYDRVHFIHRPNDADLRLAYAAADAFVSASVMEGFGIPVIESMACGTLPIVSDIPIYREVAGDSALFVPWYDTAAWGEIMCMDFSRLRTTQDLVEASRRFSWDSAADVYSQVYSGVF